MADKMSLKERLILELERLAGQVPSPDVSAMGRTGGPVMVGNGIPPHYMPQGQSLDDAVQRLAGKVDVEARALPNEAVDPLVAELMMRFSPKREFAGYANPYAGRKK